MNAESCNVEVSRRTPRNFLQKAVYTLLYNRIVEAVIVAIIAACFLATTVIDGIFHTRLERGFITWLRDVSRDRLNPLRKAQIRFVFRCQYGLKRIKIRLAGGTYWLSIPCIVKGMKNGIEVRYMAKIINARSALKHRYMTMLRNLGGFAEASELWFDEYADARDMVDFESHCLSRLKEQSIDAPRVIGVNRLNEDDYMLVIEYIDGKPLSEIPIGASEIDDLFGILSRMHVGGFIHGDIKLDNFLYSHGKIFVVDCLKIGKTARQVAEAFDLSCAICSLCEKVPVATVVGRARSFFSAEELKLAGNMLEMAAKKADIDLPEYKVMELRRALYSID